MRGRTTRRYWLAGTALLWGIGCASHGSRATTEAPTPDERTTLEIVRRVPEVREALAATIQIARDDRGYHAVVPGASWTSAAQLGLTLPTTAAGAIGIGGRDPAWGVEIVPLDVVDAPLQLVDGKLVAHDVRVDTDLVQAMSGTTVEELRVLRSARAPTQSVYRIHLGRNLAQAKVNEGRVSVLDENGRIVVTAAPPVAFDARGVRRSLTTSIAGDELTITLDTAGLTFPIVVDPAWTSLGKVLHSVGIGHAAARLPDGKVLFAGGHLESDPDCIGSTCIITPLAAAEIYDPVTGTATAAPSMSRSHATLRPVTLADGRVLVLDPSLEGEVFDPATTSWTTSGAPPDPPNSYATGVVRLLDGRVFTVGARDPAAGPTRVMIYSPTTNSWALSTSLDVAFPTTGSLGLLTSGDVLWARPPGSASPPWTSWIFRVATGAWEAAPAYPLPARSTQEAITLPDGRVVYLPNVFDPSTRTWSTLTIPPSMSFCEGNTLLADGDVFFKCGDTSLTKGGSWVLDAAGDFGPAGGDVGFFFSRTLLLDGSLLLADGNDRNNPAAAFTAYVFKREALGASCLSAATCASKACVDGVCCSSASCPCGQRCDATGHCGAAVKQSLGMWCSDSSDCTSGFCVDAVCCDRACDGQCEGCTEAPSTATPAGTCRPIFGHPMGMRPACDPGGAIIGPGIFGDVGTTECGARCDASDPFACHYATAATTCGPYLTCLADASVAQGHCDGAGQCARPTPVVCALPKQCFTTGATACRTASCSTDSDCVGSGHRCVGGTCVAACTSPSDCASGFCVDGVCCDGACAGQCEACDIFGHGGTCWPVPAPGGMLKSGAPHGARPQCVEDPTKPCTAAVCDGTHRTSCTPTPSPATVYCRPSSCSAGVYTEAATCDGAGNCPPAVTASCGLYSCIPVDRSTPTVGSKSSCATSCSLDIDCAPGALCVGSKCVPATTCGADAGLDAATDSTGDAADAADPADASDGSISPTDADGDATLADATDSTVVDGAADAPAPDAGSDSVGASPDDGAATESGPGDDTTDGSSGCGLSAGPRGRTPEVPTLVAAALAAWVLRRRRSRASGARR